MTRHRLGSLTLAAPGLDLTLLGRLHQRPRSPDQAPGIVARAQALLREMVRARSHGTDLLKVLPDNDPDRPWLEEAAGALHAVHGVQLLDCEQVEGPDGHLALTVCVPGRAASVRPGDTVCAGVAVLRQGGADPIVEPRIYRIVCTNGSLMHTGSAAHTRVRDGIGDAIHAALAPEVLTHAVASYAAAAATPVTNPFVLLERARVRSDQAEVVAEFGRAGDRTAWGLVNAATALARREATLPRRLELERDAARILAVVRSEPPARARRLALA